MLIVGGICKDHGRISVKNKDESNGKSLGPRPAHVQDRNQLIEPRKQRQLLGKILMIDAHQFPDLTYLIQRQLGRASQAIEDAIQSKEVDGVRPRLSEQTRRLPQMTL